MHTARHAGCTVRCRVAVATAGHAGTKSDPGVQCQNVELPVRNSHRWSAFRHGEGTGIGKTRCGDGDRIEIRDERYRQNVEKQQCSLFPVAVWRSSALPTPAGEVRLTIYGTSAICGRSNLLRPSFSWQSTLSNCSDCRELDDSTPSGWNLTLNVNRSTFAGTVWQ